MLTHIARIFQGKDKRRTLKCDLHLKYVVIIFVVELLEDTFTAYHILRRLPGNPFIVLNMRSSNEGIFRPDKMARKTIL
jgi:hypothetical protein